MSAAQREAAETAGSLITHYLRVVCQAAGVEWDSVDEGQMGELREALAAMVPAPPDGHPTAFIPVAPEAVHHLHRRFLEVRAAGRAEDVVRMLDDWLVCQGYPTSLTLTESEARP